MMKGKGNVQQHRGNEFPLKQQGNAEEHPISEELEANLAYVQDELGDQADIMIRRLHFRDDGEAVMIHMNGLVDSQSMTMLVMSLLTDALQEEQNQEKSLYDELLYRSLASGGVKRVTSREQLLLSLLEGCTLLLVQGSRNAIGIDTSGGASRGIEEPTTQTVIRGPKEGFTEQITTNVALVRNKIKSTKLRVEYSLIGKETNTTIAVAFMKELVNEDALNEARKRLAAIDTDSILESGYIEEFISDKTFTPFPLLQNSERPDAIAAGLLEGQFAIFVDGTPFVLLAPSTFIKFFQSSEDYYQRFDISSFLRIIRFGSFFVSMLLPSLYIAITTFHQEMLPTPLLISIAAQREGVPFPAIIEALLMEITFEILREAGVRMPRIIGPAISIVGALVLGQSAVQAGLVSAAMVIVVSFTAIASFVIPAVNMGTSARLIRFAMMIFAGTFGVFGIMAGLMILLAHLSGLRSFGVPYLTPLSPLVPGNLKDVLIRVPWWAMKRRPQTRGNKGSVRQGDNAGQHGGRTEKE
jgi:spore germination protein KA